jgi:hypothetical protein
MQGQINLQLAGNLLPVETSEMRKCLLSLSLTKLIENAETRDTDQLFLGGMHYYITNSFCKNMIQAPTPQPRL